MRRKLKQFTVVGVDGVTLQRCVYEVYASSPIDAESEAYAINDDLLIGGVFEGTPVAVDTRAQATKYVAAKK